MNPPVLAIEGLRFGFAERPLFDDWSIDVLPGVSAVRGGDGSGKTSLLKLIAGELRADRGVFRINGFRLDDGVDSRRGRVAWCDLTTDACDAVTALAWFDRLQVEQPKAFDASLLQRHIAGFGLAPHLAKPLYQLSTGSRRKVGLAGSLASGAPLTLLDQPRAALDGPSCVHLMQVLADLAEHPTRACFVADHELPDGVRLAGSVDLPG